MIKRLEDNLEIEKKQNKTKSNGLKQYDRRKMVVVTSTPHEDGENCIDIIKKICELT